MHFATIGIYGVSGPELASSPHSHLCAPSCQRHCDTHVHTLPGACTHTESKKPTHTQTQRSEHIHTVCIDACPHIHTLTRARRDEHSCIPATTPPYTRTYSICTEALLLAPNTLSAQPHVGTQFDSLSSHGDFSVCHSQIRLS